MHSIGLEWKRKYFHNSLQSGRNIRPNLHPHQCYWYDMKPAALDVKWLEEERLTGSVSLKSGMNSKNQTTMASGRPKRSSWRLSRDKRPIPLLTVKDRMGTTSIEDVGCRIRSWNGKNHWLHCNIRLIRVKKNQVAQSIFFGYLTWPSCFRLLKKSIIIRNEGR